MDSDLIELAAAHGVATSYRDGERKIVEVDEDVVVRILGLLDVDAAEPESRTAALALAREKAATGALPGTIAHRVGATRVLPGPGVLIDAEGTRTDVTELPDDLTPGYHRLDLVDEQLGRDVTVVVAPAALPETPRSWGWMLQLYALHSSGSWGIGDLGDLRDFISWTGREHDADAVLLNPLHAITPVSPVQASPYTPSSRRFATPLALRVTDLDAYRTADEATRAQVDALRPDTVGDRIEHDRIWAAKRSACELLWHSAGRPEPIGAPDDLWQFAIFCSLAERYGGRWSLWPEGLRHPGAPDVDKLRLELAPRVAFHAWLQDQVQRQLAEAHGVAQEFGVRVVHDLAVGTDPQGADGWALQDVLAMGVHVGAPPDAFSQQGQDWGLPPWRPDRLDATGYAAYRDLLQAQLRHADGLRIDHVAGLWRLWWVPPGESPDRGTYVHYDSDVMLAVLTLEAWRADALVIGEDLGTVEREVTEGLVERNILGSSVLWFTRDIDTPGDPLLPPDRWNPESVATISTHDLPTAAGFLRGEHVRARADLGLLADPDAEKARAELDRLELVELLRELGLVVGDDPGEDQLVVAMHALLARSRSRLVLISPYDVIGETRQPNLPGTVDQYPNWRLPLPESLEELRDDPRVRVVVDELRLARPRSKD
ncbi:4-alpha-glucanotransferase [Pseudonocardia charpentierae]|uniref:4-alpha-glucanotransferase n=1 Tax=Pseudonocardia charpentierae TaxID=3075545 RepID=A0ABU2N6X8_9PSEU|nr:4-alpha-glucanotransferase [Pseudonocardia sp. DSM 45834]MDT0349697.1 4-alpha-glucanotransferase [Pseudonocardia sp. DSM 45834]